MAVSPGGGNIAFLTRGRSGGTVKLAAPDPSGNARQTSSGITAGVTATNGVTFEGRLSLGLLAGLIVALIAFYFWTRSAQG